MEEERPILGFRRNIFFLGLVSFFNDFSAEMVQSVMPVFLTVVLGAPAAFVGFLEGFADALASVLKLFSGWCSDRIGRRKAPAVMGYVLSVGVRPLLSVVTNFSQVFGLRVLDRIGKGFRDAPRDALIAESAAREDLGRSFGFHRTMDTLGATLGPLVAFLLLPLLHGSYRALFLVAFVIGLGAIGSFAFVREQRIDTADLKRTLPKLNFALLGEHSRFAGVVGAIFVFGAGSLPIVLLLLKATEAGFSSASVPLVYFIYSFVFVLTAIPLGKLADRIGDRSVIAGGFLIAALAYFGLSASKEMSSVILFFILLGVYAAATDGVQRSLAAKRVAPAILATGQGFLNMAIGFSSLAAGLAGGLLWTNVGSSAALTYAGAVSLVGAALFLFMTGKREE